MKRFIITTMIVWLGISSFAQQNNSNATTADTTLKPLTDTGFQKPDTIRVGNFVIVKRGKNGEGNSDKGRTFTVTIRSNSHEYDTVVVKRKQTFSTNWFIFDLGFANYTDKTNYAAVAGDPYLYTTSSQKPFGKSDLKLITKSSNVNIWVFMQKLNIVKRAINLKYGLGLEMFNFRYDNNISYNKTPAYIFRDSVNFSKDKLYTAYATVPMMLNINPFPNKKRISFSVGASAGYLIGSHTKQKSDERGKTKMRGDFDLNQWRFAYVGELGIGSGKVVWLLQHQSFARTYVNTISLFGWHSVQQLVVEKYAQKQKVWNIKPDLLFLIENLF